MKGKGHPWFEGRMEIRTKRWHCLSSSPLLQLVRAFSSLGSLSLPHPLFWISDFPHGFFNLHFWGLGSSVGREGRLVVKAVGQLVCNTFDALEPVCDEIEVDWRGLSQFLHYKLDVDILIISPEMQFLARNAFIRIIFFLLHYRQMYFLNFLSGLPGKS